MLARDHSGQHTDQRFQIAYGELFKTQWAMYIKVYNRNERVKNCIFKASQKASLKKTIYTLQIIRY